MLYVVFSFFVDIKIDIKIYFPKFIVFSLFSMLFRKRLKIKADKLLKIIGFRHP